MAEDHQVSLSEPENLDTSLFYHRQSGHIILMVDIYLGTLPELPHLPFAFAILHSLSLSSHLSLHLLRNIHHSVTNIFLGLTHLQSFLVFII